MCRLSTCTCLYLVIFLVANCVYCRKQIEVVEMARQGMQEAIVWARAFRALDGSGLDSGSPEGCLNDCVKMYEEAESRLARLVERDIEWSHDDALTWFSAALTSHVTCLDGLAENGLSFEAQRAQNLTSVIREGLAVYRAQGKLGGKRKATPVRRAGSNNAGVLLSNWNSATSKADYVVAQDGSGNYKSINEAVAALSRSSRNQRTVVYVKSGVYKERVEIGRHLNNIMFVGDGIDKTIVTANSNVQDGSTTLNSATFGVSGDGFWARDMTFENTAGAQKHQAVALRVGSDLSVFYRCSFKGYQDTLLVHSLRQFYRDCHIYGTVDFIFGNAAAVFQKCDIFVRRPMDHQSNMITAQGRDDPNQNTGISIVNCRVSPAYDFRDVKSRFKSYLGRPWKKYSRTVVMKTDLDGLIDGKGWTEWSGNFALSTLYYAEFMNTGSGASTVNRVKWPGFHLLSQKNEADKFTVRNFIGGGSWIPATGVPFWAGV